MVRGEKGAAKGRGVSMVGGRIIFFLVCFVGGCFVVVVVEILLVVVVVVGFVVRFVVVCFAFVVVVCLVAVAVLFLGGGLAGSWEALLFLLCLRPASDAHKEQHSVCKLFELFSILPFNPHTKQR